MVSLYPNLELEVARVASLDSAMDAAAGEVLGKAKALAAGHVDSGRYVASLKTAKRVTRQGVTDRVVYSDDENAHIIEFGHVARNGKYIEGQHILGRASGGY
ncbi:DUF5403 family protein [uncultured Rothia sp.]|uniref:DUF5403 family protein n=1 Tax=uncultured Rothia sp. TaxID=316088 RepID=UPI0032180B21